MTRLPLLTLDPPAMPTGIRPRELPTGVVEGLYVHVPFCFHKCHYCDFYSITGQPQARMERFVDLALAEADLWLGADRGPTLRPRTVFFGGGTPSLLPLPSMLRLINGLRRRFDFSALEEWTIECNPATVQRDYCAALRESGVDRLSFGAQSFDRHELAALERHHEPADVISSLDAARNAGFQRLNLDLIFAIPGQDLDAWSRSLESAIGLETTHLSCYNLTYEPNTALDARRKRGQVKPVSEPAELEMLHHTRRRLRQAGLPPYEISNFAAPGQECRHNLLYWTGGDYIGLGPSAASHVAGTRWKNRPRLGEWEDAIAAAASSDAHLPATDIDRLTPRRRAGELAMLRLRLTRGINLADFTARTGFDARALFADPFDRFSRVGLLIADDRSIRLTEKATDLADAIAAEFLAAANE